MIQAGFLVISPLTGGFNMQIWSMLDSAILVLSIGITGLVPVMESASSRRWAFRAGILLYVLAIIDMSLNIVLSGVFGWKSSFG